MRLFGYVFAVVFASCAWGEPVSSSPAVIHGGAVASAAKKAVSPAEVAASPMKPEYLKALALSPEMAAALKAYDSEFVIWKLADYPQKRLAHYPYAANSLPYAVKGDFNGDGTPDIALAGHNKRSNLIVALMSTGNGYEAAEIVRWDCYEIAEKRGKKLAPAPTSLLVFKSRGTKFYFSDMADHADPLEYDGVKVKAVNSFVTDESKPTYLSFAGILDTAPDVRVWNAKTKTFLYAMADCPPNTKGYEDVDYCF